MMKYTRKRVVKQKGKGIIGEGFQGIAFMPELKCEDKVPELNYGRASPFTKRRKRYVSKITKRNIAETEVAQKNSLLAIDPYSRFTAPALNLCKAKYNQSNENYGRRRQNINSKGLNTLVFSRYRGKSIAMIMEEVADNLLPLDTYIEILLALTILLQNVSEFVNGKAGIEHYDTHPGNVVYDDDTKSCALIDFGFARPLNPEYAATILTSPNSIPVSYDISQLFITNITELLFISCDAVSQFRQDSECKMLTLKSYVLKRCLEGIRTPPEKMGILQKMATLQELSVAKEFQEECFARSVQDRPSHGFCMEFISVMLETLKRKIIKEGIRSRSSSNVSNF